VAICGSALFAVAGEERVDLARPGSGVHNGFETCARRRRKTPIGGQMTKGASSLAGQVALVTGAARRLGRAIAEGLAADGVRVVVHYGTSAREAEQVVDGLQGMGTDAWPLQADLADAAAAEALVERAAALAGAPVDVLVNSASVFAASNVLEFSTEELAAELQVNALAPLWLSRGLAAQDRPGQILNLLDCRIVEYDAKHAAYNLSKRMLFSLTRMLALELAPRIRVNAVAPGLILPPPGKDEAYLQALAHTNPLRRHGAAEDVVRAALFLLHSEFVTGQVIYVDGGRHMMGNTYGA
jgi:pteridine reductase